MHYLSVLSACEWEKCLSAFYEEAHADKGAVKQVILNVQEEYVHLVLSITVEGKAMTAYLTHGTILSAFLLISKGPNSRGWFSAFFILPLASPGITWQKVVKFGRLIEEHLNIHHGNFRVSCALGSNIGIN